MMGFGRPGPYDRFGPGPGRGRFGGATAGRRMRGENFAGVKISRAEI